MMKFDLQQPKEQNCQIYLTFTVQMAPIGIWACIAMLNTAGPTCFTANYGFRILATC
jgi:hypothetical protein